MLELVFDVEEDVVDLGMVGVGGGGIDLRWDLVGDEREFVRLWVWGVGGEGKRKWMWGGWLWGGVVRVRVGG